MMSPFFFKPLSEADLAASIWIVDNTPTDDGHWHDGDLRVFGDWSGKYPRFELPRWLLSARN